MAETFPGPPLISRDEQGSNIGTDFKSSTRIPGAWRDSDEILLGFRNPFCDPLDDPFRNSKRASSVFGEPACTTNSRGSASSHYVSARASNTSSHYVSVHDSSKTAGSRFHPTASEDSEYKNLMKEKRMILSVLEELNWAGRQPGSGQHVEFGATEKPPLEEICLLGQSLNAEVHKVKCRRILLARKRMTCGPRFTLRDAILEVEHLQRLRHSHIIQLVGSYTKGRTFSILMYLVADYELSQFMAKVEDIIASDVTGIQDYTAVVSLGSFFACLTSAVIYIHENTTAHMDIKPRNILVKQHPRYQFGHRAYIADFGISRHFSPLDHSQTDGPISFTRKYCAPEVSDNGFHGRPADIFSLGCVFLEMHTVLCRCRLDEFTAYYSRDSGTEAFHLNLSRILEWVGRLSTIEPFLVLEPGWCMRFPQSKRQRNEKVISTIEKMLSCNASKRPRALELFPLVCSKPEDCCGGAVETFELDELEDRQNIRPSAHIKLSNKMNFLKRHLKSTKIIELEDRQNIRPSAHIKASNMNFLKRHLKSTEMTELGTIAFIATCNGHQAVLSQLLPLLGAIDLQNFFSGSTPLHYASAEGDGKIVQLLLDYGTSARIEDLANTLAIHYAIKNGHAEVADQLLRRIPPLPQDCPKLLEMAGRLGQDQDAEAKGIRDKIMKSAFLTVVLDSSSMGTVTLLSHGAPMEDDLDDDYDPLLTAFSVRSVSNAKVLLEKGSYANPGARVRSLNKALHRITRFESDREVSDLIDMLLREGASLESRGLRGRTPLHYAAGRSLKMLLDKGADIQATDNDGLTPLHVVGATWSWADSDLLLRATLLLERGADIEARTLSGETVLHLAASSCNKYMVDLLLDKGANPAARNSDGLTPEEVCKTGLVRNVFKRHHRISSGDSSKFENKTA